MLTVGFGLQRIDLEALAVEMQDTEQQAHGLIHPFNTEAEIARVAGCHW